MKRTNLTLREKVALKELKIEVYKRVLSILESAKDELLIRKLQAMRLSKGIKVLVFTSDFPEKNSSKYYKKNGLFWTDSLNYKILSSYVDKVAKMKKKDWKRIYK